MEYQSERFGTCSEGKNEGQNGASERGRLFYAAGLMSTVGWGDGCGCLNILR